MYQRTLERLRCTHCESSDPLVLKHPLKEAPDKEVVDGILTCTKCKRWYKVEDGVADVVRDGLRDVEAEQAFLDRHQPALQDQKETLARGGGYWSAKDVTDEDRRIISEGHHWGNYLRLFVDAGDRAILDPRARGTYPRFYVAGILEPDDRDLWRRWGFFSPKAAEILFDDLPSFSGQWALELGSGGGQYGLEAARQGLNVLAMDPSQEELSIGWRHAREIGITNIEFIRGETAKPPLGRESIDVLLAKDSLHHVPELEKVFPMMLEVLKEGGSLLTHDHIATARFRDRIGNAIREPAIRKMRRRYPIVEIPPVLLRDSANEDVSPAAIIGLLEKHFDCFEKRHDLYLAMEVEGYIYFAFGKRKWLAQASYPVFLLIERVLLILGEQQHLTFRGVRKRSSV